MYTSHGHQIPGTPVESPAPDKGRCGGIGLCAKCSRESSRQGVIIDIPEETEELPYAFIEQLSREELIRTTALELAVASFGGSDFATSGYIIRAQSFEAYIRGSAGSDSSMGNSSG